MIALRDVDALLGAAARAGEWVARAVLVLRRPGEQAAARALAHALSLADAARSLEQDFTSQMTELAVFQADWPRERRERLALRVAVFARQHVRVDAVRRAVIGLRAAERERLPADALVEIDALAGGGDKLVDALGQLASPFHHEEGLTDFVDQLMGCADEPAARLLRTQAASQLSWLQDVVRGAGTLEPLVRLVEVLQREHPRVAAIAWPAGVVGGAGGAAAGDQA